MTLLYTDTQEFIKDVSGASPFYGDSDIRARDWQGNSGARVNFGLRVKGSIDLYRVAQFFPLRRLDLLLETSRERHYLGEETLQANLDQVWGSLHTELRNLHEEPELQTQLEAMLELVREFDTCEQDEYERRIEELDI